MAWPKIKNIIILMLLVTNLCLLAFVGWREIRDWQLQDKALEQAVTLGYIRTNPSTGCILPRVTRRPLAPLDDETIKRFLAAIQGHRFETIYLVDLFTGLRKGEVMGLTWSSVYFHKGTLLIDKQLQRVPGRKGSDRYALTSTKSGKVRKKRQRTEPVVRLRTYFP